MSSARLLEIDRQAAELPLDEQRELLTRIAMRVERGAPADERPASLRGIWSPPVPDDFDLDEALRDVRGTWTRKLDDAQP